MPDVNANIEKYGLELHWDELINNGWFLGKKELKLIEVAPLSSVLVVQSERNVMLKEVCTQTHWANFFVPSRKRGRWSSVYFVKELCLKNLTFKVKSSS